MRKLILHIPFGVPSLFITALVSYFSLTNNPVGAALLPFAGADKVAHFIMYFVTTIVYIYDYVRMKYPHHTVLGKEMLITAFAMLVGIVMECGQLAFSNHRCFEVLDLVANCSGALAGFAVQHWWLIKHERKFIGGKHHHHHQHHHHHHHQQQNDK